MEYAYLAYVIFGGALFMWLILKEMEGLDGKG